MAYLGRGTGTLKAANVTANTITANGSVNTMQVSHPQPITSSNNVSVFLDGVAQTPGIDYTATGSTITFNTTPADGCKILAITNGDSNANEVVDGSVIGSSFKTGAITAAKIHSVSASKLTGTLPALNGSALTGVEVDNAVRNSNDPAMTTNPSDGVGSIWINSTSGDIFICTDATTNNNVWTNAGKGSGDIEPYSFRGTVAGYMLGGYQWNTGYSGNIQKFSFASNSGHTSPANMVRNGYSGGAGRSKTDGYYFGGHNGSATTNEFNKFSFANESTSSSVGTIVLGNYHVGVHNTADYIHLTQCTESSETSTNYMERVAIASGSASGDIGNMADPTLGGPHTQTDTHGYLVGGYRHESPAGNRSRIEKYQFAASVTSATVADAGVNISYGAGASSSTHGIVQHGDYCRRHQFASDADAVAHGNLVNTNLSNKGGSSGENHGYFSGGNRGVHNQGTTGFPDVEQISYASNTTATDWGDLPHGRYGPKSTQA